MSLTATTAPATAPLADSSARQGRTSAASGLRGVLKDYAVLMKLRDITLMVVITAWAGFYMGCRRTGISSWNPDLLYTLLGVALTSCGSSALNQAMERVYDARMTRTQRRPMPAGRIGLGHGLIVGMLCVTSGTLLLAYFNNVLTGTLALLTVFLYVAIYTPMKRFTPLATFVGAFPGAMPPLLGWTAAHGVIEWPAVALFAILFVWQFPHFNAIAWLYRHDYARAGIRMLPVVEPDGKSTVMQAIVYAVLMVPVAVVPYWLHMAGAVYAVGAVLLSLGYLASAVRFGRILQATSEAESRGYARNLLKVSVIYLPLLMALLMLDANGRVVL